MIADVTKPILGSDFLSYFNIDVSCKHKALTMRDKDTLIQGHTKIQNLSSIRLKDTDYKNMITDFQNNLQNISPNVNLRISTKGAPVAQRPRKLFGEKLQATKLEFKLLLDKGIIRPSKSESALPLVVVRKPDGTWRPCGDYRALNEITTSDQYPLPRIHDLLDRLNNSKYFSKLDLTKAYNQIPIAEEDQEKTAVITPFGLFEYLKMPFGLRNAAQTFQRYMDTTLRDTQQFSLTYVDDVLIFSKSLEEHKEHVKQVIHKILKAGLQINLSKCEFEKEEVNFLGFQLSSKGISPMKERVEALSGMTRPGNIKLLKKLIGAISYYHWLIPNLSELLAPLYDLVAASNQNKKSYSWENIHETAFQIAKRKITEITNTAFPDQGKTFFENTDASGIAIGASLNQKDYAGNFMPISFFSRKLNETEKKYSTFDRELLAISSAVKCFKHYLEGAQFVIITDHKPLLHLMTMKEPSTRQWRAIEYLSNFSFRLEYIKGEDNVLADLLSRCTKEEIHDIQALPPTTSEKTLVKKNVLSTRDINNGTTQVNILSVTIPVRELVEEQKKDPTLRTQKDTSSLNLTKTKDEIVIDISQGTPRILLPLKFRHNEFKRIHQFSHPGAKPTIELMRVRYVWPKMRKDIRSWCRECTDCQKSKVTRHTKAPLTHIQTTGRFKNVHIDIVGPLPPVDGKRFILTMIDRATSWVEAIPLNEITANAVTTTFNNVWVSRFGPPETIISDQGLQFESNRFNEYCQDMGIEHNRTTAYNPEANEKVEN